MPSRIRSFTCLSLLAFGSISNAKVNLPSMLDFWTHDSLSCDSNHGCGNGGDKFPTMRAQKIHVKEVKQGVKSAHKRRAIQR
ncbi:hypothetical protein GOP47_0026432 [Adiantum capillus-veneris]|nr:hypothetical protein GOP47_0026432 [Adiantum capillus-veneris]